MPFSTRLSFVSAVGYGKRTGDPPGDRMPIAMTIGFITSSHTPPLSGDNSFLHRLVSSLHGRGHTTVVITSRHRSESGHTPPYPVIRTFGRWSEQYWMGSSLLALLHGHLRYRFDVIHCHGTFRTANAAYWFHRLTGIPYICRALGSGLAAADGSRTLRQKQERALSRAATLIAPGTFLKNDLLERGYLADKIVVINNGVRTQEVAEFIGTPSPLACPYLFCAGGIRSTSGFDILLKAFAQVLPTFPDLKLVITGPGRERDEFNALVNALSLTESVHYIGECDRNTRLSLHCNCRVFVAPARHAPFSNANLEAMAAGRPLVASAVDGNCEQIHDGKEGFLVPVGDENALADSLLKLLNDSALCEEMGKHGYERAHFYSWARMVDKYEETYRAVSKPSDVGAAESASKNTSTTADNPTTDSPPK